MRRKVWISTGLDLNLIKETSAEQQIASDSTITFGPEESAVFSLVVEGLSNKEIGARLNLPESAVKNTLQRLCEKAGVRTRAQLVRFAFESGRAFL